MQMSNLSRKRQKEVAAPRDVELLEDIEALQANLTEARQTLQYLRRTAKRVADELGKRGLVDLADELRLAARVTSRE